MSNRALASIAVLLTLSFCSLSVAQSTGTQRFIEVRATGTVSAKPEIVRITAMLTGTGDSTESSLNKMKIVHEEFEQSVNPMDFEGVSIEFTGVEIGIDQGSAMGEMMMMGEVEMDSEGPGLSATEKAIITIKLDQGDEGLPLEKISKLIDAAKAAKAKIGSTDLNSMYFDGMSDDSSILELAVKDPSVFKKQATALAIKNAKDEANELAQLVGAKIGSVISIKSESVQVDSSYFPFSGIVGDKKAAESSVKFSRSFVVRFGITD